MSTPTRECSKHGKINAAISTDSLDPSELVTVYCPLCAKEGEEELKKKGLWKPIKLQEIDNDHVKAMKDLEKVMKYVEGQKKLNQILNDVKVMRVKSKNRKEK